jgi:magnesium transporter
MSLAAPDRRLDQALADVTRLLEKHRVLSTLTHRQEGPKRDLLDQLQHRQNLSELRARVNPLHPADLAYVLERVVPDERLLIWQQLEERARGEVLLEVSAAVRPALIDATSRDDLVAATAHLDADDLAYLADALPEDVLRSASRRLDAGERSWLDQTRAYAKDSVGALMTPEVVFLRDQQTVDDALLHLRQRAELPPQTDRLFVVDNRNVLKGSLPLPALLLTDPRVQAAAITQADDVVLRPGDAADDAAQAFERYDLVSAPVVDERQKLIGRLTVEAVMDFNRRQAEERVLQRAGLRGAEDLFASTWASARNRWPWLCVNLITAFIASRVIGAFEGTIEQLVALAALMPIVASVGGNTGNQTVAVVIRGLALNQIQGGNTGYLVVKELIVSLLNGVMWGGLMGLFAWGIYGKPALGAVMMAAMVLNLLLAAMVGVGVPMLLDRAGRDPVQGASVLLTFATDSAGFFFFLGLARLLLV